MKLLLTGPIKGHNGFSEASRRLLKTFVCSDIEIVARNIQYDQLDPGQKFEPEDWLKKILDNDIQNIDICMQVLTCNIEAIPVPGIFNILYTFIESDRLQKSWADKANEFDLIMVACKANADAMVRSGVTKPIMVCPLPCDKDVYTRGYPRVKWNNLPNSEGKTIFYNICQLSNKKGIDSLLRAYFAAFADHPDEVLLVLKTYINMVDRTNDLQIVKDYINRIKAACRIPIQKHPPVLPIVYTMSNDEINGLHQSCDVYVCSSRAEGLNIPAMDSLCHKKTLITNKFGGLEVFAKDEFCLIYGGMQTLFYDIPHQDPGLYTGVEQCFEPSVIEMALLMRKYHLLRKSSMEGTLNEESQKEWDAIKQRQQNCERFREQFDYRIVSPNIIKHLKDCYQNWKQTGLAYVRN